MPYEQGDLVYVKLSGECSEVDVQLSEQSVNMQLTYIETQSQRTFRCRQSMVHPHWTI